jgi:hypothetical protein
MKIIKVTWRDSHRYMYQMEDTLDCEVTTIESVGFLTFKDKNKVIIAQDLIDEDLRGVLVIPKENIIKIKSLSLTKEN